MPARSAVMVDCAKAPLPVQGTVKPVAMAPPVNLSALRLVRCFPSIDIVYSSRELGVLLCSCGRYLWPVRTVLLPFIGRSIPVVPLCFEAALLSGHARLVPSKDR